MIAVERRGRLGNQMFQLAFGLAAAKRLGTGVVFDDGELRRLFALAPQGGAARRARRSLAYRLDARRRPYPIVKLDNESVAEPEAVLAAVRDREQYAGFFQSERFFAAAADAVRAAFAVRREHESRFRARYRSLLERPYVALHVRRTDYLSWRGGVALPASYYRAALETVAPPAGTPVVVVGDDVADLEQELADVPGIRFERNDPAVDLQLLVRASVVVVSNSSFGWWGGWLGDPRRRVLAPRHWLGFADGREYPPAVVPRRWTQVEVATAAAPR